MVSCRQMIIKSMQLYKEFHSDRLIGYRLIFYTETINRGTPLSMEMDQEPVQKPLMKRAFSEISHLKLLNISL